MPPKSHGKPSLSLKGCNTSKPLEYVTLKPQKASEKRKFIYPTKMGTFIFRHFPEMKYVVDIFSFLFFS